MFGIIGVTGGLAFLTRSYIAFLPLIAISIHWFWVGQGEKIKKLVIMWLGLLITIIPWHLYAVYKYPAIFWSNYMGYHLWKRISVPIETHVGGPLFYLYDLFLISSWPLTIFFIITSIYLLYVVMKSGGEKEKLWLVWAGVFVVSLTLTKTKLYWYAAGLLPVLYIGAVPALRNLYDYLVKQKMKFCQLFFVGILIVAALFYADKAWRTINSPFILPVDKISSFMTDNHLDNYKIIVYKNEESFYPASFFQFKVIGGHELEYVNDLSKIPFSDNIVVVTKFDGMKEIMSKNVDFKWLSDSIYTKYMYKKDEISFVLTQIK